MTWGHTNVPYRLCEHDWRGLRFGYGYDKASLGGCRGTLDLCVGTLFEVPAAVGEEPFDVGFLQAWLLLEDFREVFISLNEICCKFGCLFRIVEDGRVY